MTWSPEHRDAAWLETRLRREAEMRERRRGERRSLLRLSAVLAGCCLVIALLPHAFGIGA